MPFWCQFSDPIRDSAQAGSARRPRLDDREHVRESLEQAEHLADRIAILHEGRVLVEGTLAEPKRLLTPATVEYVEKQPTLEEIFLALTTRESS